MTPRRNPPKKGPAAHPALATQQVYPDKGYIPGLHLRSQGGAVNLTTRLGSTAGISFSVLVSSTTVDGTVNGKSIVL